MSGQVKPFRQGYMTSGNSQYSGLFDNTNRIATEPTRTGYKWEYNTAKINSPIGQLTVYTSKRRENGLNNFTTLFSPSVTPSLNVVNSPVPVFSIKCDNCWIEGFMVYAKQTGINYSMPFYFDITSQNKAYRDTSVNIGSTGVQIDCGTDYSPNAVKMFHFGKCTILGVECMGVFIASNYNTTSTSNIQFIGLSIADFERLGADKTSISDSFGRPSHADGYDTPTFDDSSDVIALPTLPTYGVTSGGFVNAYSVEQNELANIGADLFPRIEYDPQATITQLNDTIIKMYTNKNLVDFVLDCHVIPCRPTTATEKEFVRVGARNLTQECKKITSDYVHVSCGSIAVSEYYNNFIDYIGTNAKLYLPFIGFVPVKNEFFQSGLLTIDYHFNVIDGSFMCYLSSTSSKSRLTNSVIATYSGVACTHIPITGANYATMVSGIINGSLGALSGLSSGNVLGAIDSAMNTIASKPDISQSNGYNSSSALLSPRKPYLLIERSVSNMSSSAPIESGLPLNVAYKLSDVTGYTELDNVVVTGITATTSEQDELKRLLESGVIL